METNELAPVETDPNPTPNPNPIPAPSPVPKDMDELKKVFNGFDANGDGKISVNELETVLRTLRSDVPQEEELRRVVEDLSADRDGFINLSEFAAFCRKGTSEGGDSELRDAFDLYDKDKNGLISTEELHLALDRLGMKCSVEECQEMINSVDSDGDGSVDFDEFKQMMTAKSRALNDSVN
ncbi:putative calcium-binding protein CML27 [Trifolium repens]|jgi:calcium-binding protein CML|nr:putative calcium-binding protein CML27 [Trifolium repens]